MITTVVTWGRVFPMWLFAPIKWGAEANFWNFNRRSGFASSRRTRFERRKALTDRHRVCSLKTGKIKYDDMDLDSMKYAELRSLAKELGLKANMKVGWPLHDFVVSKRSLTVSFHAKLVEISFNCQRLMVLEFLSLGEMWNWGIHVIFIVHKQMDKLLKAIKQHYEQEENKEVGVKVAWLPSPARRRGGASIHPPTHLKSHTQTLCTSLPHFKGGGRKSCDRRRFPGKPRIGRWGEPFQGRRVRQHPAGQRNRNQAEDLWGCGGGWCCAGRMDPVVDAAALHWFFFPTK